MSTYTHTSTFTSSRLEVVAKQFERGLLSVGLSQKHIDKILASIKDKKLSAIGIYALDSDNKRVAEVKISVDWTKHENQVGIFGEQFEYLGAINRDTGETPETKVYVNALVQLAKDNDFKLNCWICAANSVRRNSSDYKKLMKSLGFGGKVEEWKSTPEEMKSDNLLALEEMKFQLKGVDGGSDTRAVDTSQCLQRKLKRVDFSLTLNLVSAILLVVVLILSKFGVASIPYWKDIFVWLPIASFLGYFFVADLSFNNKYGGWTKHDTYVSISVGIAAVASLLCGFMFENNIFALKVLAIISYIYIVPVLVFTTAKNLKFKVENGGSEQRIKTCKTFSTILYSTLSVLLVIGMIHEVKALNPLNVGDTITLGSYEQDGNLDNGSEKLSWTVHKIKNGKALLVCDTCIAAMPYNEEGSDNSWTNSVLRSWLNNDFYEAAFSNDEATMISESNIVTGRLSDEEGHTYGQTYGEDEVTIDKVFAPDLSQFWQITTELNVSKAAKAEFIENNICWGQDNYQTMFWTRCPYGQSKNYACGYDTGSEQSMNYVLSPDTYALVRPVINIDVNVYASFLQNS